MLPLPMQDSLPAGWLAFAGRELNPLDRYERFPSSTCPSSLPEFILTLRLYLSAHSWSVLIPTLGRLAGFDRLVLVTGVVLLGCIDDRGVNNLPTTSDVALGIEVTSEALKQRLDQTGPGQRFPEQPHCRRVGNRIFQAEPEKPHEREPVADLVFDLLVGQVIERLQHQNLKHHHCIERLAAGVALPLLGRRPDYRLDVRAEALEWNDAVKGFQRIPLGTDRLKTLVEIEKAGLSHRIPPALPILSEHQNLICRHRASAIFRGTPSAII